MFQVVHETDCGEFSGHFSSLTFCVLWKVKFVTYDLQDATYKVVCVRSKAGILRCIIPVVLSNNKNTLMVHTYIVKTQLVVF